MKITSTTTPATPALLLSLSWVNPARAKSTRPRQTPPNHPASEDAPPALAVVLPDSGVLPSMLDLFDQMFAEGWALQHTRLSSEDGPPLDAYGVGSFVREHLVASPGASLTVAQAYSAYRMIRGVPGWAVVNPGSFDGLIDCLVEHHHHLRLRCDLLDSDGIPQPGWQGIKLA